MSDELKTAKTILLWNDLTVTVTQRKSMVETLRGRFQRRLFKECVTILNGVSGYAVNGNLIAIMGPSGAGKTTLLATLGGKIKSTAGSVTVNGKISSRESISKISGYLPQTDVFANLLTVEEHLLFSYALKTEMNKDERKYSLTELLMELGLLDCKDLLISKLSGGQRKRLSLATELITNPKILFLDEPTTGLDMFSALQVIQALKKITIAFEAIVFCSIHQPGMDIYNLFNRVLLMSDGKVAYFGNLGNATNFFTSLGYKCPIGFAETEYYIKLLSTKSVKNSSTNPDFKEITTTELIQKICGAFSRSPLSRIPKITCTEILRIESPRKSNCIKQFYWLLWRIWIENRRGICSDWISWLSFFLSVTAVGIFYVAINSRTREGVQNVRGALYMMSSEISFTVTYSVIYELPGKLLIYLREDDVYGSGAYYAATFLGLMPKAILKAFIFTTMMCFILIQHVELINLFLYYLAMSTSVICAISYGLLFSSWIDDVDLITSIMIPIDTMFLLTAGIFYNLRSLPKCLTFFKYFSIFFYLNEALSIIYWSRIYDIDCEPSSDLPCLRNGGEVLAEYGFKEENFIWDLGGLVTLTIAMGIIGYLGLRRRRNTNKI